MCLGEKRYGQAHDLLHLRFQQAGGLLRLALRTLHNQLVVYLQNKPAPQSFPPQALLHHTMASLMISAAVP